MKRINSKTPRRLTTLTLCVSGVLTLGMATEALAGSNDAVLESLFNQANYWHEKSHDELAIASLKKVLMVEPNNSQALYLMALWAQKNGDLASAAQYRKQLAQISPNGTALQQLDNAQKMANAPKGKINLARQQAHSGNIPASLATWRSMFNGDTPPPEFAAEYYLTMASDKGLYPQAVGELRQYIAQHPHDASSRMALGKALTWHEETRREGIGMLEGVASGDKEADNGLRQALIWLDAKPDDEQYYNVWMQRHPQDAAVLSHYRDNVGGAAKGQGYQSLNSGNVSVAKAQFEQALQANPEDADALAGLGYAAQRSGDYQAAAQYLNRAANIGTDASGERRKQAKDALFYGKLAEAQQAYKQGNVSQALALATPLAQESGDRGSAAKLFLASVQQHSNNISGAEQTLRALLNEQPGNPAAQENLYYVLKAENKTTDMQALYSSLSPSLQAKLRGQTRDTSPGTSIRHDAQQMASRGDTQQAIATLQQGLGRYPDDVWMRLDLARLLQKSGDKSAASSLMAPTWRQGAGASELFAAALFASESEAWQQTQTLLSRIPASRQTSDMRALGDRANFNLQLASAQMYLKQGNNAAAMNSLKAIASPAPTDPAELGKLARMMAEAGDQGTAVALVRNNISHGVHGNAGDYADQLTVLNNAGLQQEAQRLLADPSLQSTSTPEQLASLQQGYVITQADHLRQQGNYAAAYDKLVGALQQDPQNRDLQLAMARLYQSGKMDKEAGQVYSALMPNDTPTQDARVGAINLALAEGDDDQAVALTQGLHPDTSPDRLLLLARVEESQGHHQAAMTYLRSARGKLVGLQSTNSSETPTVGNALVADNPFVGTSHTPRPAPTPSGANTIAPWLVAPTAADAGTVLPGTQRTDLAQDTAQSRTLHQVDTMMESLQEKTGTWALGGMQVRGRDGESGTSRLTEFKTPLTWSTVPFGDSRFDFTVTPLALNAGTATGDAWRRSGSNALANAVSNLTDTATNEQKSIAAMTDDQREQYFAANPGAEALSQMGTLDPSDFNPTTSKGMENLAKLGKYDSGQVGQYLAAANLKPDVDESGNSSTDPQKETGVELNMALSGDNYKADLGSSPIGHGMSPTLLGGIKWAPKLTNYLTLVLTGERRLVTDSLLSYVGMEDKYSGKHWGQVTKNGGSAQLSYDDGDVGFYVGAGGYSYIGENVASNNSFNADAGAYIRPWHDDYRNLQAGLSLSYMNYAKNLSNFSYGQGGYFSPQNYVSVSLPVDYSQKYDNWTMKVGGSVGYQSYSQDSSDYFPTESAWQHELEYAVDNGFAKEARYKGTSESGIGYSVHAGADYKINKKMKVGGMVSYDTFGDYNESTASLYFRYMLGDQ
ncbi:tetratricopeptide repeat protein [Enterobacteriaceae bacterium RIT691]|nr:tetratricopeptide repeat protein [Enterobacteriaceae bacterium RIT691]